MIVTVAILGLFVITAIPQYGLIKKNVSLRTQADELVSVIRTAQSEAISSQGGTTHGIHFENDHYTLFGDDWSDPSYTKDYYLANNFEIIGDVVGNNITFDRLSGVLGSTQTFYIGTPGGEVKEITIEPSGKISQL